MAPGAEFSLMHPPEFASLGDLSHISFLGKVVVTGATDNVLYLPFVTKKDSAEKMVINFGDGNKWELDGSLAATVYTDPDTGEMSLEGIAYHVYEEPGVYCLTIDDGASQITAGTYKGSASQFTLMWHSFGPLKEVYRCKLQCRLRNHRFRSSQFLGFGDIDRFWADSEDHLYGFAVNAPKVLYLPGIRGNIAPYPSDMMLATRLEEVYIPNATKWVGNTFPFDHSFSDCRNLRLVYVPNVTDLCTMYGFSRFSPRIDIYAGALTAICDNAFKDVYEDGNSVYDPYDPGGCVIHLHVNLTGARFRSLSGWSSGQSAHPWGAEYLRVYANDETFDCRGYWYDEHDHKTDENGVWLDENDRWIDHDGNYVMPDGVTPAVWHDGNYYKADSQGRRLDDYGNYFLNWDGHIVSDCGRLSTDDGDFIELVKDPDNDSSMIHGNILDFYGEVKYERHKLPNEWYEHHPEYDWMGYYYYLKPVELMGETREAMFFYDDYGYRMGMVIVNPPDGRLQWLRADNYVFASLGIAPTADTSVRVVFSASGVLEEDLDNDNYVPKDHGVVASSPASGDNQWRICPSYHFDSGGNTFQTVSLSINAHRISVPVAELSTDNDFHDITVGNGYVVNNLTGERVDGEVQEEPADGWGDFNFGSRHLVIDIRLKSIRVYGSGTLVAQFLPYVVGGKVVLKETVSGRIVNPTYGSFLIGPYMEVN